MTRSVTEASSDPASDPPKVIVYTLPFSPKAGVVWPLKVRLNVPDGIARPSRHSMDRLVANEDLRDIERSSAEVIRAPALDLPVPAFPSHTHSDPASEADRDREK